jgi:hypothetical protein
VFLALRGAAIGPARHYSQFLHQLSDAASELIIIFVDLSVFSH